MEFALQSQIFNTDPSLMMVSLFSKFIIKFHDNIHSSQITIIYSFNKSNHFHRVNWK